MKCKNVKIQYRIYLKRLENVIENERIISHFNKKKGSKNNYYHNYYHQQIIIMLHFYLYLLITICKLKNFNSSLFKELYIHV